MIDLLPRHGFYVDVGAHHPCRFSVTRALYEKGWHGINIDLNSSIQLEFPAHRPRDVNIFGLVGTPGQRSFYTFEEGALSTLDPLRARELKEAGWPSSGEVKVRVESLEEILRKNRAPQTVDFLSIDVEGEDLKVLKSIDWQNWNIRAVLIETNYRAHNLADSEIAKYLSQRRLKPHLVFSRSALFLQE